MTIQAPQSAGLCERAELLKADRLKEGFLNKSSIKVFLVLLYPLQNRKETENLACRSFSAGEKA
ncbi:hypothetical protein DHL47_07600 [Streptococcus panodentis]|uniref:Uncharacterized protein n=1 Tax=Streptococcus panodentis TaxID=1581472 RepID=A0ABS5AXD1_9STRE|nr:hypothetical protein [Streptococcus panodentis]